MCGPALLKIAIILHMRMAFTLCACKPLSRFFRQRWCFYSELLGEVFPKS
eukprot:m.217547 g.217547  ORF g.217547 m.217547 type:complete len:50 (-) comp15560_c0_seq4:6821-6970(-)